MTQPEPAQTREPGAWRTAAVVLAVLAGSLAVRVHVARNAETIARDGAVYIHMAHELAAGRLRLVIDRFDYPPGYPAAVAAVATVAKAQWPDGWVGAAQAVSIFWGIVALAALYFIARAAFDRRIAAVTVLLGGLSQALVAVNTDAISDSQGVAATAVCVALALAAARRVRAGRWSAVALAALAGLAAGAGYLTRPEELLAAGIGAVLLAKQRKLDRRHRAVQLAAIAAILVVAAACAAPYAAAIGELTQKKAISDFVLAPGGDDRGASDSAGRSTPAAAGGQDGGPCPPYAPPGGGLPLAMFSPSQTHSVLRIVLDRSRACVGTPVFILAGICWLTWLVGYSVRRPLPPGVMIKTNSDGATAMFAAWVAMAPVLIAMEFHLGSPGHAYLSSRHTLMPMFLLLPTAGAGLAIVAAWLAAAAKAILKRPLPAPAPMAICVLSFIIVLLAVALLPQHEGKGIYRQAGLEIRRLVGPGQLVLADDSRIAFYADSPVAQFLTGSTAPMDLRPGDYASPAALVERAKLASYSILAVSDDSLKKARAEANMLERLPPDRFEPAAVIGNKSGKIWLMRIKSP